MGDKSIGILDIEELDKKYDENKDKSAAIKNLINIKNDVEIIRADLAHFCYDVISIGFPDHPLLNDLSVKQSTSLNVMDLFAVLDGALETSDSQGSSDSGTDCRITQNPTTLHGISVKIELTDDDMTGQGPVSTPATGGSGDHLPTDPKESTPLASPKS